MRRLVHVATREYLENVRTKTFLIAIFLTPVLLGLTILVPAFLESRRPATRRIGVADVTGVLGDDLVRRLSARASPDDPTPLYLVERIPLDGADEAARARDADARRAALDRRVLEGDLFGYVVVRPSALLRAPGLAASEYRGANFFEVRVLEHVKADLADAVNARVVRERGVDADTARLLTTRPSLEPEDVRAGAAPAGAPRTAARIVPTVLPFVFTMLLFVTIVAISQALVTSTIEEKSNRVVEVLLSSVSPFELMAGKVLGTCAVGLTLMTIWSSAGLAGLAVHGLPVPGGQLAVLLVLYLLGFLFFASLMVAAGSACNTLKEAQNLLAPMMALLSISILFVLFVGREPHSTLARVLSLIPFFTPFLMMMRVGAAPPPPVHEVVLSLVILALAAALAMRVAARVFRVGVLLYGKPPSLRELFRWARSGS